MSSFMDSSQLFECSLNKSNFHLFLFGEKLQNPIPNFFGNIHSHNEKKDMRGTIEFLQEKTLPQSIYFFGNLVLPEALELRHHLSSSPDAFRAKIVTINDGEEVELLPTEQKVHLYQVPVNIHDVAVFIPSFFPSDKHFERIVTEHTFQTLTESTKPGTAHRLGIYLTPVTTNETTNCKHFRLLRCSTNFQGPTETFEPADTAIVDAVNKEAAHFFDGDQAELNHVLAQIYRNVQGDAKKGIKETKAKIKDHSDKTKDMPRNGIMAFCSFYDDIELHRLTSIPARNELFAYPDWVYNQQSALTKLQFRGKTDNYSPFTIPLCPNSVLLIPLSTNRVYTHEIRPPALNAAHIPTRMGYVIRCANTSALYNPTDKTVDIVEEDNSSTEKPGDLPLVANRTRLLPPTNEEIAALRGLYAEENLTCHVMDYPSLPYSMNAGDYLEPNSTQPIAFHRFSLFACPNNPFANTPDVSLFDALQVTPMESLGKGRWGTNLVQPIGEQIPIVRTTTIYHQAAHCFHALHSQLTQCIQQYCQLPHAFNNILLERYTCDYKTMKFHSDQALDLAEGSSIALVSCYKYPQYAACARKLVIEEKPSSDSTDTTVRTYEIPLIHGSVVVFSLSTNRRYRHKILPLHPPGHSSPVVDANEWLGLTCRVSKTFVQSNGDEEMVFSDTGKKLILLDKQQNSAAMTQFYSVRREENDSMMEENVYSTTDMNMTISPSDLMPPIRSDV